MEIEESDCLKDKCREEKEVASKPAKHFLSYSSQSLNQQINDIGLRFSGHGCWNEYSWHT